MIETANAHGLQTLEPPKSLASPTALQTLNAGWIRGFILSAAFAFLATGIAKVISAFGHAAILSHSDPILGIPFRHLMLSVGIVELIISAICIFTRKHSLSLGLIAWLTASFLIYRAGLLWVAWDKPCPCLGDLTTALHIPQHIADLVLKGILGYLVLGLCGAFCWYWKRKPLSEAG